MTDRLTLEDLRSAIYFVEHKDDISRWVGWDKKRAAFVEQYPLFVDAIDGVERARQRLRRELRWLDDEITRLEVEELEAESE